MALITKEVNPPSEAVPYPTLRFTIVQVVPVALSPEQIEQVQSELLADLFVRECLPGLRQPNLGLWLVFESAVLVPPRPGAVGRLTIIVQAALLPITAVLPA